MSSATPPNMRVQRTRSASLRSPLTRGPLGGQALALRKRLGASALAILLIVSLSGSGVALSSESVSADAASARYQTIRTIIRHNLHLNFHCWCFAYDPDSAAQVRTAVRATEADIPILVKLSQDKKEQVGVGAVDLLASLGEPGFRALVDIVVARNGASEAARAQLLLHRSDLLPHPTPHEPR